MLVRPNLRVSIFDLRSVLNQPTNLSVTPEFIQQPYCNLNGIPSPANHNLKPAVICPGNFAIPRNCDVCPYPVTTVGIFYQ
jgi:hypothetical protein